MLLFEILGFRWLLMVFPNTFEYFFIAYCAIQTRWNPRRLTHRAVIGLAAFIWIFIKLPQEWWIHVAQNDFTDFMKETVFGVEPDSSWSDAFSNRPGVLLVIVLVIVGIAVVVWRLRKRLPSTDWSFGIDMNRTDVVVRRTEPVPTSMMAAVLEKIALIGLVGAIFANVLEVETTAAADRRSDGAAGAGERRSQHLAGPARRATGRRSRWSPSCWPSSTRCCWSSTPRSSATVTLDRSTCPVLRAAA